jgi:CubicO group peptidase (beta-lactamase class C family)
MMKEENQNKTGAFIALIIGVTLALTSCQKDLVIIPDDVDQEMERAIDRGFDGMILYVNQTGEEDFYSAGFDNRVTETPADPHALFKIASMSKLYMAAATTKLIAADQLSLESTLAELIPEVDGHIENATEITLEMLLGHRSGIPEYIYHPDFESDTEESYLTTAALIFDQPADFKPDQKYAYCNTNFLLLGEILNRTLGYSHHDYINTDILDPLNLNNTYNLYSEADSNLVMSGYYKGYDDDLKSLDHTRPGGSMVSTAQDLGIFLRALIDGTLFSPEEQAIYSDVYEYDHTGWLHGYTSIARYHSDIDAVVVMFVNTSSSALFWVELEGVYDRLVRIIEKQS